MGYAPFLPPTPFNLQAAANLHMAAMAALAAQSQNNQNLNQEISQRPFLEVPREEVTTAFSQMSPTARSDISTCSSNSSSFNSLHGDLFPINLSNTTQK